MSGSDFRALLFWSKYSPQCGFHAYVHDPISLSPAHTTVLPTRCLLFNGSLAPQSSISNWATCPVPPYMLLMNSWGLATSSSALRRHRTSGVTLGDCPKFSTYHACPFCGSIALPLLASALRWNIADVHCKGRYHCHGIMTILLQRKKQLVSGSSQSSIYN